MALGSDFTDADGAPLPPPPQQGPGQPQAAPAAPPPPPKTILSYEFWQRRFGANPGVVGTVVRLGDQPFEIIGVLQQGFELLYPPDINVEVAPDLWTPLRLDFAAGSRVNVFLRVDRTAQARSSTSLPLSGTWTQWPPTCARSFRSSRPPEWPSGSSRCTKISCTTCVR